MPSNSRSPSACCCAIASCSAASAPDRSPVWARMKPAHVRAASSMGSKAPARVRARLSSMSISAVCGSPGHIAPAAAQKANADSAGFWTLRATSTASIAGGRAAA